MITLPRMKLIVLVLAATFVLGACSSETEVGAVQAAEPVAAESQPDSASTDAAQTDSAQTDAASTDSVEPAPAEDADTEASGDTSGVAPRVAVVTFGDEEQELSFDLFACSAFGPDFMSVAGLPLDDTPADTEFRLDYQQPMLGDDDTTEYDNTIRVTYGIEEWTAGTVETPAGVESWGELNWTRNGDVVTGTAVMVHSWGTDIENSEPRNATFVVNCT